MLAFFADSLVQQPREPLVRCIWVTGSFQITVSAWKINPAPEMPDQVAPKSFKPMKPSRSRWPGKACSETTPDAQLHHRRNSATSSQSERTLSFVPVAHVARAVAVG